MPAALHQQWLNAIHAAHCGVVRMSTSVKGVVATSNNLEVVRVEAVAGLYSLLEG